MSTDPGQLCSLKTLLKNIAQTVKSFFIEFASLYQNSVYQSLKSKQKTTSSTKLLQNYRCRIKFHSDSLGFAFLTLLFSIALYPLCTSIIVLEVVFCEHARSFVQNFAIAGEF